MQLMMYSPQANSLRELASGAARAFQGVTYLQLGMICLIAPIFMAGAIAQEANPKTWDILLTTPLNALQIVLGNLFGRLFFIIALLCSSLPLFLVTQYFGGVPGQSILLSYVIAAISALVVGAIAIALSVSRQAGRRAVFLFYITVVIYLGITWSIDNTLRGSGLTANTTWATPFNPFLVQETLLQHQTYTPLSADELAGSNIITRYMLGSPVASFCWIGSLISIALIAWSTIFLRLIGQRTGQIPWYQRFFNKKTDKPDDNLDDDAQLGYRKARDVWKNPIAWREASRRNQTVGQLTARYGFLSLSLLVAFFSIVAFHIDLISIAALQSILVTAIGTEVAIITLTAINISATAISREREDGTLDLLLTTSLTPSYYVTGKLRGIVVSLLAMIAAPVGTVWIASAYVLSNGLGRPDGVTYVARTVSAQAIDLPFILPESAIILPLVLIPFIAFCSMVGLHWSLKSKGVIQSVIAAISIIVAILGVLTLCGIQAGNSTGALGGVLSSFSPTTSVYSLIYPASALADAFDKSVEGMRISMIIGAVLAAVAYSAIIYGIHKAMLGPSGRNFDMTVRRLAGTN